MWYAVETVFIDGKLFGSKCCFKKGDKSSVGHCYADLKEEPRNSCKREFDNRIEIHTDWFESEELAEAFCNGKITYIHYYDTYYRRDIKSTMSRFAKREIVNVDEEHAAHRGMYIKNELEYRPYWAR